MKTLDEIKERWKKIEGYENLYEVSNLGRVKSLQRIDENGVLRKEYIRKLSVSKKGYNIIQLRKDGKYKMYFVHRIVAEAFIPNPSYLPQVNHKDENKENNCADNLEWCDVKYNNNYGNRIDKVKKKLSCPIVSIRADTGEVEIFPSISEAARMTCSSRRHISLVLRGERKTHNNRIWKYDCGGEYENRR